MPPHGESEPTVEVKTGSPGSKLPKDNITPPSGKSVAIPVDTVDAAAEDLLKSAAEEGPVGDALTVKDKVLETQYEGLAAALLEKEKKTGDLKQRSNQAMLHVAFTDMRVTQLEEKLRKLQAELHNKPENYKLSVTRRQCPVYKTWLKPSLHGEFRLTPQSVEIPIHERPSMEILVSEHDTSLGLEHDTANQSISMLQRTHQRTPERLRIRYGPLIKKLEQVCRETLSSYHLWGRGIEQGKEARGASTVFLRPWKLFVAYEQEIRKTVHNVEELMESARKGAADGEAVKKGVVEDYEYEYEDLMRELKLLIEFLDVDLKPTFNLRRAIQDGTATDIEYADLWHLFQLGDTVISSNDKAQAFRVVNFTGGREPLIRLLNKGDKPPKSVAGFAVDCYSLCFDGTDYVPKLEKFSIREYKGRRPITSLEVFPLRFQQDWAARLREFELQGEQYLELTRSPFSHRMFKGKTVDEPSQDLNTQVIVDVTLAINSEPDWRPPKHILVEDFTQFDERETQMPSFCMHGPYEEGCCGSDYVFKDLRMNYAGFTSTSFRDHGAPLGPRSAEELKQEDIILLPSWIYAFVLRNRQWVTLRIADLSEVLFDNNFDELMFSVSHKQTIAALVETHENARTAPAQGIHSVGAAMDVVKGKGAGLIILLHGEPGVGKTSTAECVADKTKRPLLPITCGDIGETAMEVEENLYHNFRLAHKWGCVLLLDEADVFLAKRNRTDLRRNAVTSVFLRSLEYYAGILFLTTNRVGSIDPAFKSRIQLTVYYPRIDLDTTVKLYEGFLKRARAEQSRIGVTQFKIKEKEILKFGARHYRHLKKEGYTIALVQHEAAHTKEDQPKPVLGKRQFEIVAAGSKEFDRYLMKTLQGGDDEIARRDQWRDDHYHDADVTQLLPSKATPKASSSRVDVPMVTDSESDDSDDSETEDEEDSDSKTHATAKKALDTEAKAHVDEDEVTSVDFEEFLRFKALMGKKKKNT